MAKDKRYFGLIEIRFIAKQENKLHFFSSIYLIFYLIPKICFKQYGWGWLCRSHLNWSFLQKKLTAYSRKRFPQIIRGSYIIYNLGS